MWRGLAVASSPMSRRAMVLVASASATTLQRPAASGVALWGACSRVLRRQISTDYAASAPPPRPVDSDGVSIPDPDASPFSTLFRRQKLRRREFRWRLDNSAQAPDATAAAAAPQLKMSRVLVVSKISRFEHERESHPSMSDGDLKSLLAQRGSDFAGLKRRYDTHTHNLNILLEHLRQRGIPYDTVRSSEAHQVRDLSPYDAVLSAGGDGTFLTAAALVLDDTPVIGFNTDSERSEGHLCVRRPNKGEGSRPPPLDYGFILDSLMAGRFQWRQRQRIRISVNTGHIHGPLLMRRRALNDVLFAADHTYDATYYEMHLDGGVGQKQKSSGLLAATGTGSTAWLKCAAKVSEQYVHEVLRAAAKHSRVADAKTGGAGSSAAGAASASVLVGEGADVLRESKVDVPTPTHELVSAVTRDLNRRITFSPARLEMGWLVREPIVNGIFKVEQDHGFAKEILIRSRCPSAQIIADGQPFHFKISDGHSVKLGIDPEDCLWTVSYLLDDHKEPGPSRT